MVNGKVFILGGRSGTTLMQKLLIATGEFRNWHHRNVVFNPKKDDPITFAKKRTQTPYGVAWKIFETFPNVPNSVISPMKRFSICKLPEFDLVIDKIIKMYKNPLFIILDRNLDDIVDSHIRAGMGKTIKEEVMRYEGLRKAFRKHFGRLPNGNWKNDETMFWKFLIDTRERMLKGYDENNVLRINFTDFMTNFKKTMIKVSNFLEIKPIFNVWNNMRYVRTSLTSTNVTTYINKPNGKEIVPDHMKVKRNDVRNKRVRKNRLVKPLPDKNVDFSFNNRPIPKKVRSVKVIPNDVIRRKKRKKMERMVKKTNINEAFAMVQPYDDLSYKLKGKWARIERRLVKVDQELEYLSRPKVSFAFMYKNLITLRGKEHVEESLRSISGQSDDIMLMDNDSEDKEEIKRLCLKYGISYINIHSNEKYNFAYDMARCSNAAIQASKYDIFVRLTPDIVYPYNFAWYISAFFEEHDPKKYFLGWRFMQYDKYNNRAYAFNGEQYTLYRPYLLKVRGWDERTTYFRGEDHYGYGILTHVFEMERIMPKFMYLKHNIHTKVCGWEDVNDYPEMVEEWDFKEQLNLLKESTSENKHLVENSFW